MSLLRFAGSLAPMAILPGTTLLPLVACSARSAIASFATTIGRLRTFQEHGPNPDISTYVCDWSGDGSGVLNLSSRKVSTFVLLLKMKGVESAVWPWLFPVPKLCDTALIESQEVTDRTRLSLRHSFCLKARSSVSAYVVEFKLAFYLFDVFRARSFFTHCILARRRGLDVACTIRNEAMSEQYWRKEGDLCADLVRIMHHRSSRSVVKYDDVHKYCHTLVDFEPLAFPNVFMTLTFAEWKFPSPFWMRPHFASQPEGSALQILHIYDVVIGVLRKLLRMQKCRFWDTVVEYLVRVEFQGRGTLHFHIALWALVKGNLEAFVHSP